MYVALGQYKLINYLYPMSIMQLELSKKCSTFCYLTIKTCLNSFVSLNETQDSHL